MTKASLIIVQPFINLKSSEPAVQPAVTYGRCVTGNGWVLSVLTMYPRKAFIYIDVSKWILSAVRRMRS